jgi:hypothetical protein
MSDVKHSPTPWHIGSLAACAWPVVIFNKDNLTVCEMGVTPIDESDLIQKAEQDAAFIVQVVNSHSQLTRERDQLKAELAMLRELATEHLQVSIELAQARLRIAALEQRHLSSEADNAKFEALKGKTYDQ